MDHPNRRRDGHVGHDILFAASGESGQKGAGGLNSVLRIPGETNYGVLNIFRPQIGAVRTGLAVEAGAALGVELAAGAPSPWVTAGVSFTGL